MNNIWKEPKRTLWQQMEAEMRAVRRRQLRPLELVLFLFCLALVVAIRGISL